MDDQTLLRRLFEAARADLRTTPESDQCAAGIRCLFDAMVCTASGIARMRTENATLLGPSTLMGTTRSAGLIDTIATDAIAAHFDDLDDVHWHSLTHPGSVIWPALMAVGKAHARPLTAILDAASLGYQVLARMSKLLGDGHRRYFHVSTSGGGVAVAAAVASLLEESPEEVASAMSHAASCMGGTAQAVREHSRTAMLHRGFTASIGTIAAYGHSLSAVREPVEGDFGFVAGTGITPVISSLEQPLDVAIQQVTFRRHPVSGFAHTLVDALIDVGPLDVSQVAAIDATVPSYVLDLTNVTAPTSAKEAAWCVRHIAAAAVVGELPGGLRWPPDPQTEHLRSRVNLKPRPTAPPDLAVSGQVTLTDGGRSEIARDVPYGHPNDRFPDYELAKKAERLGVMTAAEAVAVLSRLRRSRGLLVDDLLRI